MITDNEFDLEQLKYIPPISYGKLFAGCIESYVEAYPRTREVLIKILYKHKTQETYYVEFSENIGYDDIDKVFRFINDNVVPRFRNNDTSGFDVEKYAKQDIPNIKSIHRYHEGERKMVENNFGFKLLETAKVEQYEKIDENDRVRIIVYAKYIDSKPNFYSAHIYDIDDENKHREYPLKFKSTPEEGELNNIFEYASTWLVVLFRTEFSNCNI